MKSESSNAQRFREARERKGLSIAEVADAAGISNESVWDLEMCDDELETVCGCRELQSLAKILGVRPAELMGITGRDDALTPEMLAAEIKAHCSVRAITLAQFSAIVGWDLSGILEMPEFLMTVANIDGIKDICRELGLDWERVIAGL